jgi:hypothetical protein
VFTVDLLIFDYPDSHAVLVDMEIFALARFYELCCNVKILQILVLLSEILSQPLHEGSQHPVRQVCHLIIGIESEDRPFSTTEEAYFNFIVVLLV